MKYVSHLIIASNIVFDLCFVPAEGFEPTTAFLLNRLEGGDGHPITFYAGMFFIILYSVKGLNLYSVKGLKE